MKYNSFEELEKDYNVPYEQGKYEEVLTILNKGLEELPKQELENHLYDIMFFKTWLYIQVKAYEEGLDTLSHLIEREYLCPLQWGMFKPLEENETFQELKEKNELLRSKLQEKAESKYEVFLPEGYTKEKKYPVFFTLHGDGKNIEHHKMFWKPDFILSKGYIVVYLQSSQVSIHDGYAWTDREYFDLPIDARYIRAYSAVNYEIKNCYESISQQYSVDEEKIIIGGFSGGAMASIHIAISNLVPVKGVIPLCADKPKSFTEESVKAALERGVKWVFMDGEKDVPVQDIQEMIEEFKKQGVPYEYYINKGIGHWYPEDIDEKLENALNFIME